MTAQASIVDMDTEKKREESTYSDYQYEEEVVVDVEGCSSDDMDEEKASAEQRRQCNEVDKPGGQPQVDVQSSATDSDEEYDELCDAVQEKAVKERAHRRTPDIEEDTETDDEELHDADQHQQQTDNIHSDLVTPELSAEEKESLPKPPKLSHKKSHKKRSPKNDQQRRSSRKLEYKNQVPLHKAIKRKLLVKSDPKPKKKQKRSCKKKRLQQRTIQQDGTWVQCMHSECLKWRHLREITDPSLLPEHWVCEKNPDPDHNSCDHPEENYHSLEFVFTKFAEGSIVWAKMQGYPWWPAMIEEDPDTGTYLEQEDTESYPTHYHIVFLDKNVSRTWLKSTSIRKFDIGDDTQTQSKGRDFKQQIGQAVVRANTALAMSVQERIQMFGFSHTFKGKIMGDSQQSTEDENANPDSDQDQDEEGEEDVAELDLEALGLDVDDILEQAEALLSEAGETIQSLQDTSEAHEPPKKSKRGRKPEETTGADEFQGKTDHKGKKKRKRKEKSPEDAGDMSKEEKKEKKHKSHHHRHHHHSKKWSKGKEDGTEESKDDTIKNQADDKTVEDTNNGVPQAKKAQSKNKDEVTGADGSAKKLKKPHFNKNLILNEVYKTQEDDNAPPAEKSDADAKPKKARKPRVKKQDDSTVPKIKKPRPTKAPAAKQKTEDSTKTTAEGSEKLPAKAICAPHNQDQVSKLKIKKGEAALKMKPSFKPPSKSIQSMAKGTKKAAPVMRKGSLSSKKQKHEPKTKDEATDYSSSQSGAVVITKPDEGKGCNKEKVCDARGPPQKQRKLCRSDTTANKTGKGDANKTKGDASKTKRKAKFIIKKTNSPSSLKLAELTPSEESSKNDVDSCTNAEPIKNNVSTSSDKPDDQKPDGKQVKKAAPKKFGIKHKTPASANPSVAPAQSTPLEELSTDPPDTNRNDMPATTIKTPSKKRPDEPTQKSTAKKFSIKHKPSTTLEMGTPLNHKIDNKDGTSQSQPKKMKSNHEEKMEPQNQGINDADDGLLLNLDESPLFDDATMASNRGEDGVDEGEDSDDFSMEDLEDWPKDFEIADASTQGGPNKLIELAAGNDADTSQSFEIVEE